MKMRPPRTCRILLFTCTFDATCRTTLSFQSTSTSTSTRQGWQQFRPSSSSRILNTEFQLQSSSGGTGRGRQDPKNQIPDINLLDNSQFDTERRPLRIQKKNDNTKTKPNTNGHPQSSASESITSFPTMERKFQQWGVETIDNPLQQPTCPGSIDSVAQAAFHAISSTLYCQNYLDPNIVSNAMAVSVSDKRPVGFAYWPPGRDVGRLGIEIDGARHLLMGPNNSNSNSNNNRDRDNAKIKSSRDLSSYDIPRSLNGRVVSRREYDQHIIDMEGRALRRLSLVLASKLSQAPWAGMEDMDETISHDDKQSKPRPVALFFNTLRQALMASKELQLLQKVAKHNNQDDTLYDNIRILCLGSDGIPKDMTHAPTTDTNGKQRRKWGASRDLSDGKVDPKSGLILVVQPTDFNNELKPPTPAIGTVQQLQALLARATVAQLPTVVISPRLTEQFDGTGIDQSGYQRSSTYGGVEVSSTFLVFDSVWFLDCIQYLTISAD